MPTPQEEDIALVSLITSAVADAAPYMRREHFLDLFPVRRKAIEWIRDYQVQYGIMPSLKAVRAQFPAVSAIARAEPIQDALQPLTKSLIDTVCANSSEQMSDLLTRGDHAKFVEISNTMASVITKVTQPIEADISSDADFVSDLAAEVAKDGLSSLKTMPTGLGPLDEANGGGIRPGNIIVLSSLVNLGKTYVAAAVADNLRKAGYKVLFYSLEMPKKDINLRLLAIRHNLNADEIVLGRQPKSSVDAKESYEDWYMAMLQRIQSIQDQEAAASATKGEVLVVGTDGGPISTDRIVSDLQSTKADVVIIDAAQDIRDAKGTRDRTPALYNAVSELNTAANRFKVGMFFTVQLDAEVERKGLSKGNLTRIAWGQVFAQKATIVLTMLGERDSGIRDLKIEKNRGGMVGRNFWLTMTFPVVKIEASGKPPGTLDDLDKAVESAESLPELTALMQQSMVLPQATSAATIKPPAMIKRMAGTGVKALNASSLSSLPVQPQTAQNSQQTAPATGTTPQQHSSPYALRRQMKESRKKGKK